MTLDSSLSRHESRHMLVLQCVEDLSSAVAMQATGKNFIMDSKFNLGNLLELGLHNYVDACSEIVDRAQKELIIEKALKKIDETWSALSLTFSPYQDTDNVQMTVEDTITEALETDNLALQTMSGGKYVQVINGNCLHSTAVQCQQLLSDSVSLCHTLWQVLMLQRPARRSQQQLCNSRTGLTWRCAQGNPKFLEIVTNWQRKLGTVDVVLNTWLDVQKKWQALESIFVGSADIRVQLPEDSKRFDVVNADFQVHWVSICSLHRFAAAIHGLLLKNLSSALACLPRRVCNLP